MAVDQVGLVTYNLYRGADLSVLFDETDADRLAGYVSRVWTAAEASRPTERMRRVAALLAERRPEVVALQEASLWRAGIAGYRRTHDLLALLVDSLRLLGEPYQVAVRADTFTSSHLSQALTEATGQVMEVTDRTALLVREGAHAEVLDARPGVFTAQLSSTVFGRDITVTRGWCSARLRFGEVELPVVCVHLDAYSPAIRLAQVTELIEQVLPTLGPDVVVLGDLNSTPRACAPTVAGDAREPLSALGLVDAWAGLHPDDPCGGATFALRDVDSEPDRRLDALLCDPGHWQVLDLERFGDRPIDRTASDRWPSDHAGLFVGLAPVAADRPVSDYR